MGVKNGKLTPVQIEVGCLLVQGMSYRQIDIALGKTSGSAANTATALINKLCAYSLDDLKKKLPGVLPKQMPLSGDKGFVPTPEVASIDLGGLEFPLSGAHADGRKQRRL